MPQLATICYIDNGEAFLMLHRNKKSPMMSMKASGSGVGGKLERGKLLKNVLLEKFLKKQV